MAKPPLAVSVEIENHDGRHFRWDANDRDPRNRPRDVGFGTQRGDGFAAASVNLARRADTDYQDLGLLDTIRFIGHDGTIAYEGRVASTPRSVAEHHSVTVEAVGWMSHARDRQFTEIYVDRDLGNWQGPSRQRRKDRLTSGFNRVEPAQVELDISTGLSALVLRLEGPGDATIEGWYDAGANRIAAIFYDYEKVGGGAAVDLQLVTGVADDDLNNGLLGSGDLFGPSGGAAYFTPSAAKRWAHWAWNTNTTLTGAGERTIQVRKLAVYGDHGLTRRGPDPGGFFASDVIRDIASRFAPRLNPSGVLDSDYPISQIAFRESTDPYDAFLLLNDYHFRELAVWEGPTLHWHPADLSDFDWQVRLGEDGVTAELQGDSTDGFRNGIVVEYEDFKGGRQTLFPTDHAELRDDSEENPANQHGIQLWGEPLTIPYPTNEADALTIGAAALAETNLPKAPGRITVPGHIRDRQGNWQPAWRVRAGERIAITNHPNDRPRLVTDTRWNQESKRLDVQVERPSPRLDALFNRIATRRAVAGLT